MTRASSDLDRTPTGDAGVNPRLADRTAIVKVEVKPDGGAFRMYDKRKGRDWLENSAATNTRQPQAKAALDAASVYDTDPIRNPPAFSHGGKEGIIRENNRRLAALRDTLKPMPTIAAAIEAVKGNEEKKIKDFLRKDLRNRETGVTAQVTGISLNKMKNESSWGRSVSVMAHYHAMGNLDTLFELATLTEPGRAGYKKNDALNLKRHQDIHYADALQGTSVERENDSEGIYQARGFRNTRFIHSRRWK